MQTIRFVKNLQDRVTVFGVENGTTRREIARVLSKCHIRVDFRSARRIPGTRSAKRGLVAMVRPKHQHWYRIRAISRGHVISIDSKSAASICEQILQAL